MPSDERNDAGCNPAESDKAAPNALAITRETLAPLDAKEREMLMVLLNKLR
jgi:MarR family transcriptional regulator, lower aerobic nicotinate degradation pathway regulator